MVKVPFLDLKAQYHSIKNEVDKKLIEVCENTAFTMGPFVEEFEKKFSEYLGVKHFVATSTGTSALHTALLAFGIGNGDEVLVPVNTFTATAEAVVMVGAKPVFVDNDPLTYNMDVSKIEQLITHKTRAIIPVHLYGQPADMEKIGEIASKHNLIVIEDCAQAHGAKFKGKMVGTFGHAACFSFYPGKNLGSYGEGGGVATNSDDIAEKMDKIRNHGSKIKYVHEFVGYNYHMHGFQGAVLTIKLKYLDGWNKRRREIAEKYTEKLKDIKDLSLPYVQKDCEHVFHLYVIRTSFREELRQFLNDNGVGTNIHYPYPLHLQESYKFVGYKQGDFPIAEEYAPKLLSLPMYPEMTDEQIEYVVSKIKEFYKGK
uniref:DegT/DnrJ/EryC1/StrS family aminotransferase n=1 Tax=candidate division WOR-3 bacterium TaxID=2052148 RepID=A0A7C3J722_UNCW3